MTRSRSRSVATSSTIFLARLTRKAGTGAPSSRMMSKRTRVRSSPSGVRLYSPCSPRCADGLRRVPHHPAVTPVVFQDLFVGDAHDLQRRPDVMRPSVGVTIEHLGRLVQCRPRRHCVDVGEHVEDRLRRGVDDDLARCSNSHVGKSNPLTATATANARVTSRFRRARWCPSVVSRRVRPASGRTAAQARPARRRRCPSRWNVP